MLESNSNVLTVQETANLLNLSRQRIYQLAANGKLSTFKMGGTVLVSRRSVELLIDLEKSKKR